CHRYSLLPDVPPLSLHDALPIWLEPLPWNNPNVARPRRAPQRNAKTRGQDLRRRDISRSAAFISTRSRDTRPADRSRSARTVRRSEEHTSELQSPYDLVCRLLHE